jgi:hypothetical protein
MRVIDSDDSRLLDENYLKKMQATAFTTWLSSELENMEIEDYITADLTMWANNRVSWELQILEKERANAN